MKPEVKIISIDRSREYILSYLKEHGNFSRYRRDKFKGLSFNQLIDLLIEVARDEGAEEERKHPTL